MANEDWVDKAKDEWGDMKDGGEDDGMQSDDMFDDPEMDEAV